MNSTQWKNLTQFASYLGREGICRVEETEKGLFVSWIDNSPETMRRREAIMKKERQDKGDEEREQQLIKEQVERARRDADHKEEPEGHEAKMLQRKDGEKLKLNIGFGSKPTTDAKPPLPPTINPPEEGTPASTTADTPASGIDSPVPSTQAPVKLSMSAGAQKPKNVFALAAKKNPLAGKKGHVVAQPKKISEQERIMKAEMEAMERKRSRFDSSPANAKRPKIS